MSRTCLELETFRLDGCMTRIEGGVLDINLLNQSRLKLIHTAIGYCSFYRFTNDVMKQSKEELRADGNERYSYDGYNSLTDPSTYRAHIHLSWKGKIKLELLKYGFNY